MILVDLSKLGFYSGLNYLKRSSFVGSEDLTLASSGNSVQKVINHNLGYIPFFQVGADLTNDGTIWSNDVVNQYTETSISGYFPPYPTLTYWCDATNLTIDIYNGTSPASSGTRTVYWAIYLDYDS